MTDCNSKQSKKCRIYLWGHVICNCFVLFLCTQKCKLHHLGSFAWKPQVYVAQSTLPKAGQGLFAARSFQAGNYISVYLGLVQTEISSPPGGHVLHVSSCFVDGSAEYSGKQNCLFPLHLGAHMVNDANFLLSEFAVGNNGYCCHNAQLEGILMVATTDIMCNSKIFIRYLGSQN